MITEPLFQKHILDQIFNTFDRYLFVDNWILQYLGALFIIYLCYKVLTYKSVAFYPNFLPTENYPVSLKQKDTLYAFVFLCSCFFIYSLSLYFRELTFFNNIDTMGRNTMHLLQKGVTPMWGINGRLSPVAFWDVNIIYAVTHNFKLINIYIILQTLFIVYLLNSLLNFIPQPKKEIIIGLFILSPVFFWVNLITYPEKWLLIYVIGSLIFLKKYTQNTSNPTNLWYAILLTNLALYTKENTILLYFGILVYSVLYNIYIEKINLSSFIHPLRTCRQLPLETLLFISLLIFAHFWLENVYMIIDSPYLILREKTIIDCLKVYYFELFIILSACILCFKHILQNKSYILLNGLILGSCFLAIFTVFIAKMAPITSQMESKPYYLILAYMVCLIYLLSFLKNKKMWFLFVSAILVYITLRNIQIEQKEEGRSYREVAQFLISKNKEQLNLFISQGSEPIVWCFGIWSTVYKYYWPNKKIHFFTSGFDKDIETSKVFIPGWNNEYKIFHPINYKKLPSQGDFYIIKKTEAFKFDKTLIRDLPQQKVFTNKFFEVYEIQ
ncbi:MAG: hypothetical protein IJ870_06515 [Alphaproteobacteria bacterium]|nr:hypothetical protein [Alphaproteobacteria bacterium]